MTSSELSFQDYMRKNPCSGCPAPCCRMQVSPYTAPTNFMQVDHIKYLLHFSGTEVLVTRSGDWHIVRWGECCEFNMQDLTCKLHNTPEKPKICARYDPHECWYKRIFVTNEPPEAFRLNLARFNEWVKGIRFDDQGKITNIPDFELSLEIFKTIPLETTYEMLGHGLTATDMR
jgi:hypothetical protein